MCRWFLTGLIAATTLPAQVESKVEFNRDIRPILSDRCYTCHGPAVANRISRLRLDSEQGARLAIVPGNADASELVHRITGDKNRMPPPYSGPALSAQEIN